MLFKKLIPWILLSYGRTLFCTLHHTFSVMPGRNNPYVYVSILSSTNYMFQWYACEEEIQVRGQNVLQMKRKNEISSSSINPSKT